MSNNGLRWASKTPEDFAKTFQEYRQENKRDITTLVAHQARELADDLFKETYVAKAQDIRAKVKSLGWQVKRPQYDMRFRSPKIHRAMKSQYASYLFAATYTKDRKLREFQKSIISIRVAHIGALRAGWIPAMQKLGSKMRSAQGNKRRKNLGSVEIHLSGLTPYVAIINNMPGIVALNKRDDIIGKAFKARAADMRTYIAKKRAERLIRTWKRQAKESQPDYAASNN